VRALSCLARARVCLRDDTLLRPPGFNRTRGGAPTAFQARHYYEKAGAGDPIRIIVCVIYPNNFSKDAAPSDLIIGPGPYDNANGSIDGNGPHNPFINQSATFTATDPSITDATTITDVVRSFGTQFGVDAGGIPGV
jgi:hypothetical protein